MKAWQLFGPHDLRLVEVDEPVPGPGQVAISVGASGICHSDIMMLGAPPFMARVPLPVTIGHEFAGTVTAIGPGVRGVEEGDRVVVYNTPGCGRCDECVRGFEGQCVNRRPIPGVQEDGGMADFVVIDAAAAMPIGTLDFSQAAPLSDAGKTAYQGVRLARHAIRPGGSSVVVGVGGLGHMAVQFLAMLGSQVVAVDVDDEKLALAERCGAVATVRSDLAADVPDLVASVNEAAGGRVDAAFDYVGIDQTLQLSTALPRPGGAVVVSGTGGGSVPFGYGHSRVRGVSWVVTDSATKGDLRNVLALAEAGRISMHVETFDFGLVDEIIAKLADKAITGRAVVCP